MSQKPIKFISIARKLIQITSLLFINFMIFELIFSIDLSIFRENGNLIFPFLQSPRDAMSSGTGILEFIIFSFIQGDFPFLLIGLLIILILITSKFFCGWICPVGLIQDILVYLQEKSRKFSIETDLNLKKIKYWIVGIVFVTAASLGLVKFYDEILYIEFSIAMRSFCPALP